MQRLGVRSGRRRASRLKQRGWAFSAASLALPFCCCCSLFPRAAREAAGALTNAVRVGLLRLLPLFCCFPYAAAANAAARELSFHPLSFDFLLFRFPLSRAAALGEKDAAR